MARYVAVGVVLFVVVAATGAPGSFADDEWCAHVAGGPSGEREVAVDLSAAHAAVRLFGPGTSFSASDPALADALDAPGALDGTGVAALERYAEALAAVCLVPTNNAGLQKARVEMSGQVAMVRPGIGPVLLPPGTRAVVVDLRGLPDTAGLREALENAVAPALRGQVLRPGRRVRSHNGLTYRSTNAYSNNLMIRAGAALPALGTADLPLALITGRTMPPEAVEIAGTLRLANRAWLVGEDLFAAVAETQWQGVGGGPAMRQADAPETPGKRRGLGRWGLASRAADLLTGAGRWPDRLPADEPAGALDVVIASLPGRGGPPALALAAPARPPIERFGDPYEEIQPLSGRLGDVRAALLIAHGMARAFFTYFDVVGDRIDPRLMEVLANVGQVPPPSRTAFRDHLRRFAESLQDGHVYVVGYVPVRHAGAFPVFIDQVSGEPVIGRSLMPGVNAGDTIVSFDGRPVADLYAREFPLVSAATDGWRFVRATDEALVFLDHPTEIGLRDPQGALRTVIVDPAPSPAQWPLSLIHI